MQLAEKQELVRLLSLYQADLEIACFQRQKIQLHNCKLF